MNLAIIGAGNIGLITALCFAKKGHRVVCIDSNKEKITNLKQNKPTFYEPGLDQLLDQQLNAQTIKFETNIQVTSNQSSIFFVCVGTPNNADGESDLSSLISCIQEIADLNNPQTTVIIKSTVPPLTNKLLSEKYPKLNFISSPEFLREGSAIEDCLNPSRIIIGSLRQDALLLFKKIYANFDISEHKYIVMDSTTAEISKYASNIFLASKISLINEFSRICESCNADVTKLKEGVGSDPRIGSDFLNAGIGFGGSCLPKDIDAFFKFAEKQGESLNLIREISKSNIDQILRFSAKIKNHFSKNIEKKITVWGLSFKPETDDLRDSPSVKIIEDLLDSNFKITLHDPKAENNFYSYFRKTDQIVFSNDLMDSLTNSNALFVATDWDYYKKVQPSQIKARLSQPVIFDGRNIFDANQFKEAGFTYISVGRSQ